MSAKRPIGFKQRYDVIEAWEANLVFWMIVVIFAIEVARYINDFS